MQGRNVESWEAVLEQLKQLTEENTKLKEENEMLLNRLQIADAYRFVDKQTIIVN